MKKQTQYLILIFLVGFAIRLYLRLAIDNFALEESVVVETVALYANRFADKGFWCIPTEIYNALGSSHEPPLVPTIIAVLHLYLQLPLIQTALYFTTITGSLMFIPFFFIVKKLSNMNKALQLSLVFTALDIIVYKSNYLNTTESAGITLLLTSFLFILDKKYILSTVSFLLSVSAHFLPALVIIPVISIYILSKINTRHIEKEQVFIYISILVGLTCVILGIFVIIPLIHRMASGERFSLLLFFEAIDPSKIFGLIQIIPSFIPLFLGSMFLLPFLPQIYAHRQEIHPFILIGSIITLLEGGAFMILYSLHLSPIRIIPYFMIFLIASLAPIKLHPQSKYLFIIAILLSIFCITVVAPVKMFYYDATTTDGELEAVQWVISQNLTSNHDWGMYGIIGDTSLLRLITLETQLSGYRSAFAPSTANIYDILVLGRDPSGIRYIILSDRMKQHAFFSFDGQDTVNTQLAFYPITDRWENKPFYELTYYKNGISIYKFTGDLGLSPAEVWGK